MRAKSCIHFHCHISYKYACTLLIKYSIKKKQTKYLQLELCLSKGLPSEGQGHTLHDGNGKDSSKTSLVTLVTSEWHECQPALLAFSSILHSSSSIRPHTTDLSCLPHQQQHSLQLLPNNKHQLTSADH